jgi:hypothetical protein
MDPENEIVISKKIIQIRYQKKKDKANNKSERRNNNNQILSAFFTL